MYVTINLLLQVSEQIYSKIHNIEKTVFVGVELQNSISRESTRIVQIFLDPGSKSTVVYLCMCVCYLTAFCYEACRESKDTSRVGR
jgi:hypothetical protein